jgi:dipeptidyl aminopeptidase/acylaminoacyl peptidase
MAMSVFGKPPDTDQYLQDLAETQNFSLGRPIEAMPTTDGKSVIFLRSASPRDRTTGLYRFDVASGQTEQLAAPEKLLGDQSASLSSEERMRRERTRTKVTGITSFALSDDGTQIAFTLPGRLFLYQLPTKTLTQLKSVTGNVLDPTFSPDGRKIAYVRDYNLFVCDLETDQERLLTTRGTETTPHGMAEFVAQEEMARTKGFWWLPDGKTIVYQVSDNSKVEVWYVGDPSAPENRPYPSRYPRPGKNNVNVRLAFASVAPSEDHVTQTSPSTEGMTQELAKSQTSDSPDVASRSLNDGAKSGASNDNATPEIAGKTTNDQKAEQFAEAGAGQAMRWIEWDHEKYPYLVRVSPTKNGPLTITVETRDQHELTLLEVDLGTGATRPLLKEDDPDWVNIDQSAPVWLPSHEFVWTSERNGAWQLELRHPDGSLDRVIVPSDKCLQHFAGVAGSNLFFLAGKNPSVSELWRANLNDTELTRVASGFHTITLNENGAPILADAVRAPDSLAKTLVRRTDGTVLGELPSVAEEPPYFPRIEFTDDSTNFISSIVRPRDFDGSKKYPVIVDVYAGPGFNRVEKIADSYLVDQWLADQGYVVVSFDGRGTPGRGRDWERAIYQKFGEVPLADQVSALTELAAKHPEMDLQRVGITGWSFGGYMSALAVLRRPDIFKAAVAGAPVTDWLDYDTHYTERYLGLPGEPVYAAASLIGDAPKLSRPLLIIHGTADDNVYFRQSLKLMDALEKAGRSFQFLPIAGSTHMVLDPGLRVQIEKRTVEFFKASL